MDSVNVNSTLIAVDCDAAGVCHQIVQERNNVQLSLSRLGVTLKVTLYGDVSAQRLQEEKALLEHRLNQLS